MRGEIPRERAPRDVRCASCEEPIPSQGVRCAACRAPHHPKCFFGRGERCGVCRDASTPRVFDVAPDEIRIGPGAAARSLTRWVIRGVVPLTIAGLAAWGWYQPGAQSKPLEPRKVPGAVGALRMTVAPVALPGTGSWHTLTLPTDQPCTDLFLELGAQDAVDPVTLASLTVNSPIRCELALGRSSFLTESPVGFVGHPMMRTQPPLDPGWRASFAWADTIGSWTLLRRWPGLSLRDHVADP